MQVADEELVERVTGRRLDPETNIIYHLKFKPPPDAILNRLVQRSDDTEDKLRNRLETHHKNVEAVIGYYKDILVEVAWLHRPQRCDDRPSLIAVRHMASCTLAWHVLHLASKLLVKWYKACLCRHMGRPLKHVFHAGQWAEGNGRGVCRDRRRAECLL